MSQQQCGSWEGRCLLLRISPAPRFYGNHKKTQWMWKSPPLLREPPQFRLRPNFEGARFSSPKKLRTKKNRFDGNKKEFFHFMRDSFHRAERIVWKKEYSAQVKVEIISKSIQSPEVILNQRRKGIIFRWSVWSYSELCLIECVICMYRTPPRGVALVFYNCAGAILLSVGWGVSSEDRAWF